MKKTVTKTVQKKPVKKKTAKRAPRRSTKPELTFHLVKLINGEEVVGLGHVMDDGLYIQDPMLFTTSTLNQAVVLSAYTMLSAYDDAFFPAHAIVSVTEGSDVLRELYDVHLSSGVPTLTRTYLDKFIQNSIDLIQSKGDVVTDVRLDTHPIEEAPSASESAVDRLIKVAKERGKA